MNVHRAKTQLSKLIEQAERGEEVVIARNGKPAVRLVPVPAQKTRKSLLGAGIGKLWTTDDWDSAKTNEEIAGLLYGDGGPVSK